MIGVLRGERFGQANDKILGVEAHYDTVDGSPGTISPSFPLSLVVRKPVIGVSPTRSVTNRAARPHKMARGLIFGI